MAFTDHVKMIIGADAKGVEQGLAKAEKKANKFADNIKSRFIGLLGVAAFTRASKAVIDFGASIGDLSDRVGVSAEFLQTMQFAAEQNGSSAEEAGKAVEKLSKSIGEATIGSKLYADAFDRLGVSLKDNTGQAKTTEQIFKEVANGLQDMNDPALRVKTAFDLMGRSGTAMIQFLKNGEGSIDDYNKKAKELGLIVENDQVKALQAASGELEKAGRQFKVFGAQILPPLVKVLRNAHIGLKLLTLAFKTLPGNIEIAGKILGEEFTAQIKKAMAFMDLLNAKLQVQMVQINPFADDAEVAAAQANLEKRVEAFNKAQINAAKSLKDRKNDLMATDDKAFTHIKKGQAEIAKLQKEYNILNGVGLKGRQDNAEAQEEITRLTKEEQLAAEKVVATRGEQEKKLERILERINAIKKGGEDALKAVEEQHKLEDEINNLMEKGGLTRDEAVKFARDLHAATKEEVRLLQKAKDEQEQKVKLKEQEADRAEIARQLKEEARLHAEAKREMQQQFEVMKLRAAGNDEEADHLEKKIKLLAEAKDIAEEQGINEKDALDLLRQKLDLEKKITQEKLNQDIDEIKAGNLEIGKELDEMGATERANALRAMTPEERKRAKEALRLFRLEEKLKRDDLTDDERAKLEEKLKKGKDKLLTDDQKKAIEEIEKKKKEAQDQAAKLKKELDQREKDIKAEIKKKQDQAKKDLEALEKKAKEKIEAAGDKMKEKLAAAYKAGEAAIRQAGAAIVNAINRIKGNPNPVVPIPQPGDYMENIKNELVLATESLGSNIGAQIGNITLEAPELPTIESPQVNNEIKIELEGELLQKTQDDILAALQGKFVNE